MPSSQGTSVIAVLSAARDRALQVGVSDPAARRRHMCVSISCGLQKPVHMED